MKQISRKFKNKPLIITGSFLYSKKYKDIDIFIIEKYDKEDYKENKFHFNYLPLSVYSSLFFQSIKKLCVSNFPLSNIEISHKINLDTFISLYQEVSNDFAQNHHAVKQTLRDYLLQSAYLKKSPLPDSQELKNQIESILNCKNTLAIIKKIFVETVILAFPSNKFLLSMRQMIDSYQKMMQEYPNHKDYYLNLAGAFQEVIDLAS